METMRKEEHIGSTFIDHNPAALPPRKRLKSLGSSASPPSTPSTPPPPLRASNDYATTPQGIKRKKPEANEEQKELFAFSHLPPRKALKLKNDTPSPSDSEPEQPARKGRPGRRPGSSNKAPKRARKNKEEETLYCLCRQPYDEQVFMIACDVCDDWFHGKCVGVTERQGQTLKTYICPLCSKRGAGHRRKRSVVKVDEDDAEANVNVEDEDEEEKENHEYQQQRRKRAKGQAMTRGRAKSASGSMARRGSINGTAAGRRGEGYDSPSAHSDDAAHFPTGETDSSKEDVVPRRVCVNKACSNSAKLNSKYCSTECGVRVATQFLEKQKAAAASEQQHHQQQQQARPSPKSSPKPTDASVPASNVDDGLPNFSSIKRSLENSPDISAADDSDLRLLESLERQRGEVEQHLRTLAAKREEFAKAVQFSSALFASDADISSASQPSTGQHSSSATTSSSSSSADGAREGPEMMDCFSCGQPIPGRNFARHLEQCYAKKEGLGSSSSAPLVSGHKLHSRMVDDGTIITYCNHYDSRNGGFCAHPFDSCPLHSDNKGKDEQLRLCGCPTGDFASGHCERLRRDCVKHFSWESIRKKDMELEKERQTHLMSSLDAEIEIVKARIRRRSSTRDDEHRTIEENATSTRQQHAPASK